jgi:TRAP-type C4-dicarboxylate transport system substrate-binding protein
MDGMKTRGRLAALVLPAAALLATVACSGGGAGEDKAGGSGKPVVLRLANTSGRVNFQPAVADFVQRVEQLSGGDVRIKVVDNWGEFVSDAEQQVVRDVATNDVDLGWVGTRVFDTLGIRSFEALTAPMLINSYALENAVIESGITEQMMEGLDGLGVVGLDILPDGLRKPVGVKRPIVGPSDWRGITFGTLRSKGQAEAIRALGATPAQVFGTARKERIERGTVQGFEMSLWNYQANVMPALAPYVTANVNLWPQMDVLLANPARFAELSDKQRGWLEEAARDAATRSAALADKDAEVLGDACATGAGFGDDSEAHKRHRAGTGGSKWDVSLRDHHRGGPASRRGRSRGPLPDGHDPGARRRSARGRLLRIGRRHVLGRREPDHLPQRGIRLRLDRGLH